MLIRSSLLSAASNAVSTTKFALVIISALFLPALAHAQQMVGSVCTISPGGPDPFVECTANCPSGQIAIDGGGVEERAVGVFGDQSNAFPIINGFEPGGTPNGPATGWASSNRITSGTGARPYEVGVWVVCMSPSSSTAVVKACLKNSGIVKIVDDHSDCEVSDTPISF